MEELLTNLGIKIVYVIGSICGSVVSLIFAKKVSYTKAVIHFLGGFMSALFLTDLIIKLMPFLETTPGAAGFLTGFCSMGVLEGIFWVTQRFSKNPIETIKQIKNLKEDSDDS